MASTYNFTVEQGATCIREFVWNTNSTASCSTASTPVNLTGYTARMQIRETVESSTVLYEASTTNGHLAITAATGTVKLTIPAATSAAWTWTKGVYDLELTSPTGVVTRLVKGTITVSREVTR